ncbi:thioredoxin TrxC [Erwinia tracheiphila]|uniref:Thioredoxin n=1 Tax=Erwinia tracheiphila TaxID=65700 RepID=A0A0M2KL32_9GAMM|nr:thioredoxin TrxC [Erwinia tracheiphila]AXF75147.1 thioredoxin TrxC [Erwinia tracheiphila]EOS94093.1 thioredoxin 2 [Erwinia tracheiphila PSU-1]KKF38022.1 thioredoxin [Erwinia tracheiphila]UIA82306.1 thioredoxin TrxC [Erwinia tracheiphila]UIA89420.1 thioredoxin TrxC [Erwinia tracheiphila]
MNTVCASCQATNRLPQERINEGANCGKCGNTLFSGEVINATTATFDKYLQDGLPVVVDFWAPWCGPCVNFSPVYSDVAQELGHQIRFLKVNTEAESELSARFRIRSIPTIMIFKQGKVVDILNGAMPKGPFTQWLDENI